MTNSNRKLANIYTHFYFVTRFFFNFVAFNMTHKHFVTICSGPKQVLLQSWSEKPVYPYVFQNKFKTLMNNSCVTFVTNVTPIHFSSNIFFMSMFCEGQKIIVLEQLFHFNGPVQIVENLYKEAFINYTEKEKSFLN